MSDEKVRTFRDDEAELRDNYVQLAEDTGESFDSIARRLETYSGDAITAAKVRSLGGGAVDEAPKKRRAPVKATAAPKAPKVDAKPAAPKVDDAPKSTTD